MDHKLDDICFLHYRIKSFKTSPFEKVRKNCSSKKMAEAGFYYTPMPGEPDLVTCYACGSQVNSWCKTTDDPFVIHNEENPKCLYIQKKKNSNHELTVKEFIEIEKFRYMRLNDDIYETNKKQMNAALVKVEKLNQDAPGMTETTS